MDKFGIFKLLSSLNDFYQKTKGEDFPLKNLFSNQSSTNQEQSKSPSVAPKPLQANMISVMQSHDEFVKRVKSTNKNP